MSQDLENKTKSLMKGPELLDVPIQDVIVDDIFQQIDKVIEKIPVIFQGKKY
jgi:protein-tyrosine phosphatase